jgi:hypothetical protein
MAMATMRRAPADVGWGFVDPSTPAAGAHFYYNAKQVTFWTLAIRARLTPSAPLLCLNTKRVAEMHKFYVPRSVTMKAIDDCRSTIARNHGSKVDVGVDLIGIYLDTPDSITLLMAKSYFSGPKRVAAES